MKRKVGALEKVDADLPNLQHKIGREPLSYADDFLRQYQQYQNFYGLVIESPSSAPPDTLSSLHDFIDFIAHVANHYPDITKSFTADLSKLLTDHHEQLSAELREKIAGSLVLLRKKEIIDSATLLNTLFPILVSTPSKTFRTAIYQKIISDIRSSNAKTTNHKLNRTLQTVLHNLLTSDRSSSKGIWAVRITRELWRRQIWTDSKAVEIMKEAALGENTKVIIGGTTFFLGGDKEREEAADASSDDEGIDMAKLRHSIGINKSKKKAKQLKSATQSVKKKARKKNQPHPLNFSALHLLHDPQGFADSLFTRHLQSNKSKLNLEHKLLVLQLVTRLVGLHKLTIISLYSFFLKYLTPRQASVTSFLASLAQATHNMVPPDVLEPLIIKIANEFVSEASAGQVAAAGLNAIREICVRQPLAMNETLLQDLVIYRKSKDKGVMMAARGLMSLYREVGAEKLKKRDRGKEAALNIRAGEGTERRFGQEDVGNIEGLDLLQKWKEEERRKKRIEAGLPSDDENGDINESDGDEDEDAWKNWDIEDDDSDDSGGWIDVESDGEDLHISDSDNEPAVKKAKTSKQDITDNKENAELSADATLDTAQTLERISNLATTRILTPADLAKLNELRLQSSVQSQMASKSRRQAQIDRHADDPLTAAEIESAAALGKKKTKEDKIAAAKAEREDNHQSTAAKRKEKLRSEGKSTTNKEKARKKNFLMTLGKAKGKQKRSLRDVGKVLKGHVDRQKRGGKRGNK